MIGTELNGVINGGALACNWSQKHRISASKWHHTLAPAKTELQETITEHMTQ